MWTVLLRGGGALGRMGMMVGVAATALTIGGCLELAVYDALTDRPSERADDGRFDSEIFDEETAVPEGSGAALDVRAATIEGDLGDVHGIDDHAPFYRGWSYDGYASLDVHTTLADGSGAAMTILGVTGGLAAEEIRPGARFVFDQLGEVEPGAVYMTLIGCSGPTDGDWVFDQSAETLEVEVTEGTEGDTIVIDYTATFPTWAGGERIEQVVNGSVEVGATQPD